MNGPLNNRIEGEAVIWPDATLERFEAGYDEFKLHIREDAGGVKVVRCSGYIGFQMVGFWDEIIIENAKVTSTHPLITDCVSRLKSLPKAGSRERTTGGNGLLEIILIDGCKLWICAHRFYCENG